MLCRLRYYLEHKEAKRKIYGIGIASVIIFIMAAVGVMFGWFFPPHKAFTSQNKWITPQPPQFLYELYGGDQEFEKKGVLINKGDPAHFKGPLAITTSPEGKVFVADTGHSQIQVFSPEGQWIKNLGKGKIPSPTGLIYFEHKLYIADPNTKKIFVYEEGGKELPLLLDNQKLTLKGGTQGQVIRPSSIQVGPDGLFYITDIANQCIVVLDGQGKVLKSIGSSGTGDGQFQYPNALFVNKDGKIYVSDSNNGRIQIFDKEGMFLTKINGSNGKYGPMALPRGIAVTDQGLIYVVDVFSNMLRVYDEVGVELWVIGGIGNDDGQFNFPNGLCLDSTGHIYVTDRENNRIQVFEYK
ncbi:hypothetical protein [Desulfitobacterium sp. AusDCA]|uniref:hypothetical protein n=1 Tax=Desulfitobacterium sp. AusDCA TaxID=3240383 RepID=UPI003DA6F482